MLNATGDQNGKFAGSLFAYDRRRVAGGAIGTSSRASFHLSRHRWKRKGNSKQRSFTVQKYLSKLAAAVLFSVLVAGCASLPEKATATSMVLQEHKRTARLARIFDPAIPVHSDDSGFILLRDGERALRERLYLADIADHTIDLQYYIWNSDRSGKMLARKMIEAADRGVSVRILLDDFSVGDRNQQLLEIDSHANIEIRVYNPFVNRSGVAKLLNFALDFERLNRRMHNKTYSVDGVATIVGGRNIGDEYFNFNERLNFQDLDLFAVGPAARMVSQSFQEYWTSPWAIPIDLLVQPDVARSSNEQTAALTEMNGMELSGVLDPDDADSPEAHFAELVDELIWAPAIFIYDRPGGEDKEAYPAGPKRVAEHLLHLARGSEKEILVESAYFVLDDAALELIAALRTRGVKMRALTNSMSSNDVLPNHASYAMVRRKMLNQGIELYELRPDASSCLETVGKDAYCDEDSHLGLHAKAAVFDRKTIYVGSCNLNLRSAYLNTETGMFVESAVLAETLSRQIDLNMRPENSWRPQIQGDTVIWVTETNGAEEILSHEPQTSWFERVKKGLFILVPGALYY